MPERATIPAYTYGGKQLPAGEAPHFKRAELDTGGPASSAGDPLDKQPPRPERPCSKCGRRFKPTRKRWLLCLGCFSRADANMEP